MSFFIVVFYDLVYFCGISCSISSFRQIYKHWIIIVEFDFLLLERIQNKQEQMFLALSISSLKLNKCYFNLDTLGLEVSIIKLIQLSGQMLHLG